MPPFRTQNFDVLASSCIVTAAGGFDLLDVTSSGCSTRRSLGRSNGNSVPPSAASTMRDGKSCDICGAVGRGKMLY